MYTHAVFCWSIDDADLRRTLQSLACANKKVLKKIPAGRDVNDDDKFYYNADFTHPLYQVRIDSIQAKETVRFTFHLFFHVCVLNDFDMSNVRWKKRSERRLGSRQTASSSSTRLSSA
jgi:Cullin family